MSEIQNINAIQRLQSSVAKREKSVVDSQSSEKDFAELLKTVEKLELMDNELDSVGTEINKVVKHSDIKNTLGVSSGVNKIGSYIKNIEGLVENLSTDKKNEKLDNGYKIAQYSKNTKTGKP